MKIIIKIFAFILILLATVWLTRGLLNRNLPDLQMWHQPLLESEFRARDYPNGITFTKYRQLEVKLVEETRTKISDRLKPNQKVKTNRYFIDSPAHPSAWPSNWNLSYEHIPENPRGGIILLHGASDSPYSMRALSNLFYDEGLYVIAVRLPGHGTIAGELTDVQVEDWLAIVPMAVAQTKLQIGNDKPIYIGGYSAGGALALNYALDATEENKLQQIDGIFMFSPAIGVSVFAAFARWDYWVSKLPYFEKFAWVSIRPEYDPFKYSSFPKQAGHLVHAIATNNQKRISKLMSSNPKQDFPPVITFQSLVDRTTKVKSVISFHQTFSLSNSQLVLFDINRNSIFSPFFTRQGNASLAFIKNQDLSQIDFTFVSNDTMNDGTVVANRNCVISNCETKTLLRSRWPHNVFSLSHLAIQFPDNDPLYGINGAANAPDSYNLGNLSSMGEIGVLVVPAEERQRLRYNPFFEYVKTRILEFCNACKTKHN